jgi:hypothetical protein
MIVLNERDELREQGSASNATQYGWRMSPLDAALVVRPTSNHAADESARWARRPVGARRSAVGGKWDSRRRQPRVPALKCWETSSTPLGQVTGRHGIQLGRTRRDRREMSWW